MQRAELRNSRPIGIADRNEVKQSQKRPATSTITAGGNQTKFSGNWDKAHSTESWSPQSQYNAPLHSKTAVTIRKQKGRFNHASVNQPQRTHSSWPASSIFDCLPYRHVTPFLRRVSQHVNQSVDRCLISQPPHSLRLVVIRPTEVAHRLLPEPRNDIDAQAVVKF